MVSGVWAGSASAGSMIVVVYVKLCPGTPFTVTLLTVTVTDWSLVGCGQLPASVRPLASHTIPGPEKSVVLSWMDTAIGMPPLLMATFALVKSAPRRMNDQRGYTAWY